MAKKQIVKIIKLMIKAGKASPGPPIGPALGSAGVNIMAFCKEFNARTQGMGDTTFPTVITVFSDKSFTFITKQPPNSELIKKEIGIPKGSSTPPSQTVGVITKAQALKIARQKIVDMNTTDEQAAIRIIFGTARSMGIETREE